MALRSTGPEELGRGRGAGGRGWTWRQTAGRRVMWRQRALLSRRFGNSSQHLLTRREMAIRGDILEEVAF